jgi:hypothetical protein
LYFDDLVMPIFVIGEETGNPLKGFAAIAGAAGPLPIGELLEQAAERLRKSPAQRRG